MRVQPAAAQHHVLTVKKVRRVLWVERVSLKPCTNTHIASAGQVSTDRGQLCVGRGAADVMPRNVSARQPAEDVQPSGPPGRGSKALPVHSQPPSSSWRRAPLAAASLAAACSYSGSASSRPPCMRQKASASTWLQAVG